MNCRNVFKYTDFIYFIQAGTQDTSSTCNLLSLNKNDYSLFGSIGEDKESSDEHEILISNITSLCSISHNYSFSQFIH